MDKYKALLHETWNTYFKHASFLLHKVYMVLCIVSKIFHSHFIYIIISFIRFTFFLVSQWFQEQGRYFYGQN